MDSILKNTLKELEITQKEFWNVAPQTGNFLNMLIRMNNSKSVLEIGTSNGYSGLWMLDALKSTHGKLSIVGDRGLDVVPEQVNGSRGDALPFFHFPDGGILRDELGRQKIPLLDLDLSVFEIMEEAGVFPRKRVFAHREFQILPRVPYITGVRLVLARLVRPTVLQDQLSVRDIGERFLRELRRLHSFRFYGRRRSLCFFRRSRRLCDRAAHDREMKKDRQSDRDRDSSFVHGITSFLFVLQR